MIHTQISSSNIDHATLAPNQLTQESFEHDHTAEEYKENQETSPGREETEDPLVLSHLPPKKASPKKEKLNTTLKKSKTSKKKEQPKHHLFPALNVLQSSEKDHVSFKKINELPRSFASVESLCSIPEKNLLLLMCTNRTVQAYNTMNFHLVAAKQTREKPVCMSYSQQLGKIIVGGQNGFLQLWSPKSFKIDAECLKGQNGRTIRNVAYVPESNVIVAKLFHEICIYNTELTYLKSIKIRLCFGQHPKDAEIVGLSKSFFLTFRLDENRRTPILFNLDLNSYREFSKGVYIPSASCVKMTENTPKNVFTCLGSLNGKPSGPEDQRSLFKLVQFSVDTKMEELVPLRSSHTSAHSFRKLSHIENSKYFLAERYAKPVCEICLVSVDKTQVEILKVISTPSSMVLNQVHPYIMTTDGRSLVELKSPYQVVVHRTVVYREKLKDSSEEKFLL